MQQGSSNLKQSNRDSNVSSPFSDNLITEVVEKNLLTLQEFLQSRIEHFGTQQIPFGDLQKHSPKSEIKEGEDKTVIVQELNSFHVKLIKCKHDILEEMQIEIDSEREKYVVVLNDYEQKSSELIQLQAINHRLANAILQLKQENASINSGKQTEQMLATKKTNQKLVQQNKQQIEKLYVYLSQNQELKEQLKETQKKYEKTVKQLEYNRQIYHSKLREHEEMILNYQSINYDALKLQRFVEQSQISEESKAINSVVKMEIQRLKKQIQILKERETAKEEEFFNLRELVSERQDDNRYLRNQMLNKDQEIFKLKSMRMAQDKMGSRDSLKYSQDQSKIIQVLEPLGNRSENQSSIWRQNEVIIEDEFEREREYEIKAEMERSIENQNDEGEDEEKQQNQQQKYKQTGEFVAASNNNTLIKFPNISKPGISELLSSEIQNVIDPLTVNQIESIKITELQNQNRRLKQDLNNLYNAIEDSKREEELALIKNERDALKHEIKQLKTEEEEYVIKIHLMEKEVEESNRKASDIMRKQEWNNELIEKLRQQNSNRSESHKGKQMIQFSTFEMFEQEEEKNRQINRFKIQKQKLNKQLSAVRIQLLETQQELEQQQDICKQAKKQTKAKTQQIKCIEKKLYQMREKQSQYLERIERLEYEKNKEINKLIQLANKYKQTIKTNEQKIQEMTLAHEQVIHRMQCEMLTNKVSNNPFYRKFLECDGENARLKNEIEELKLANQKRQEKQAKPIKMSYGCNTSTLNNDEFEQKEIMSRINQKQSSSKSNQLALENQNQRLNLEIRQLEYKHKVVLEDLNLKIEQLKAQKEILKEEASLATKREKLAQYSDKYKQQNIKQKTESKKYSNINKQIEAIQAEIEIERMKLEVDSEHKKSQSSQEHKAESQKQKLLLAQIRFLNQLLIEKDKEIAQFRNTETTKIKRMPSNNFKKQQSNQPNQKWKVFYRAQPTNYLKQ